jgi:hypothetical protein
VLCCCHGKQIRDRAPARNRADCAPTFFFGHGQIKIGK